ncbi:extracellular serine protease [Fusarium circinatum]|uniref:Extracellular serine protease n=1 Tax=Fusarium circinatum TaxID=48490 RepID=A0A8H6CTZ7_FUSCI|nr:extracellular serine protease [Fusarium circinatum]
MSEALSDTISEKWRVLQTVLPVFYSASLLPINDGVNHGGSGTMDDVDRVHLQHAITALRTDLKLNMLRQSHIGVELLLGRDINKENLASSLRILFDDMESLIDKDFPVIPVRQDEVNNLVPEVVVLVRYPKLMLLCKVVQMYENRRRRWQDDRRLRQIPLDLQAQTRRISQSWRDRYGLVSVQDTSHYVRFPRDCEKLKMLRKTLSHFRLEMENIKGQCISRYRPEVRIKPFTTLDAEKVQHAQGIAATYTSIFTRIVDNNTYGKLHGAKLHLSGFMKDQLKLDIKTYQGTDMVSAVFTRSFDRPPNETFDPGDICSLDSSNQERINVLNVAFDQSVMWIQNTGGKIGSPSSSGDEEALDLHLSNWEGFPPIHRKLFSVLFAGSIFQLSDTPWIEPSFDSAWIFLPMPMDGDLEKWCPRIYCNLESRQATPPQGDIIAALGVILMELEGLKKSEWLHDRDEDWITEQPSNHFRLFRMLDDIYWKQRVTESCRRIARTCLEFDGLVDDLEYPGIVGQKKALTIIRQCILRPLYLQATTDFGELEPLLEGMEFGPEQFSFPPTESHLATARPLILFDDDVSVPTDTQQSESNAFRQINLEKSKSFVPPDGNGADDWQVDTCGHGTNVTELLLETAPAAEIFVCKISTDKVISQEYMSGIEEAIRWATTECDAHIISMSFGYEDLDDSIEDALKNAISKRKLLIAAASNSGGLKGRSRPAKREGVLCIHATDGRGNKGSMNPSPKKKSDNFATLGVNVFFQRKGEKMWKSGTSLATPIAAGFAAAVLEFARYREVSGSPINRSPLLNEKRGVQQSRDGQGGVLAKALDGIIGGNASIHMGRYDGDKYRIDNVETTHFYPTDDYYEKCLQLHDVKKFIKGFKYKKPIYLITGLKFAHRASITMESRRQIGADTEASVPVPIAPVDLEVGAQAGASSSSEVMCSFTQDDAFVLAIQVQKIYHKRAFPSGETKLATKPVFKGAVLVDDDEIGRKDEEADEVNYELHDLDEEDMKRPTLLNSEDGDEA